MTKKLLIGLLAITMALTGVNLFSTTIVLAQCVDEMIIPDSVWAFPGETVRVPVYGQVCGGPPGPCEGENLDGIVFRADFNTTYLTCLGVDYMVTGTDNLGNSYTTLWDVLYIWCPISGCFHIEDGYVYGGVIGSYTGTPDWSPDTYRFWDLLFEVSDTLPEGDCCPIQLTLSGHTDNYFTYFVCNTYPELNDGSIYYPPGLDKFIRGDYDGDGQVLTNDPLMMLQYIFGAPGAIPPSCEDAADYTDDGMIVTGDALIELGWIFGVPNQGPPAAPYPHCGPDLTPWDELDCSWHEFCMGGKAVAYKPSMSVKGVKNRLVVEEPTPINGIVRIPIDLTVNEAVCGFDISLGYDASLLRFKQVVGGDGYDFYAVDTRQEGIVRIGGVPDIEMAELMGAGTHRVAEILFTVEDLKDDVELDLRGVEIYGANVQPLSVEWVNGVVKSGVDLPKEFTLIQNYPNPFNSTTFISYALPVVSGQQSAISLKVFNILGQRVATLVDGAEKAGYKTITWDAKDLASGIYFYKLTAGNFTSIRKMVLLK